MIEKPASSADPTTPQEASVSSRDSEQQRAWDSLQSWERQEYLDRARAASPASSDYDDSALALLARQLNAAVEASHRELDAPLDRAEAERVAWADGYTQACEDIRAAIKAVASDGT